jgi:hypothetical protein
LRREKPKEEKVIVPALLMMIGMALGIILLGLGIKALFSGPTYCPNSMTESDKRIIDKQMSC